MNPNKRRLGEWMTVSEAADYLDVHCDTLKRVPPAELPYLRVNARGDRKYRKRDLDAYVERRMVRS